MRSSPRTSPLGAEEIADVVGVGGCVVGWLTLLVVGWYDSLGFDGGSSSGSLVNDSLDLSKDRGNQPTNQRGT
jgi:hypothetical protein